MSPYCSKKLEITNNVQNKFDSKLSKGPAKSRHFFPNDHGRRVPAVPNQLDDPLLKAPTYKGHQVFAGRRKFVADAAIEVRSRFFRYFGLKVPVD